MAMTFLKVIAFDLLTSDLEAEFPRMHSDLELAHGDGGGVKVVIRDLNRSVYHILYPTFSI